MSDKAARNIAGGIMFAAVFLGASYIVAQRGDFPSLMAWAAFAGFILGFARNLIN